jgi:hypothetical protein
MGVKISDLTSLATSTFADDDILEIEQYVSVGVYQTRKMTGAQIKEAIKTFALTVTEYTASTTTLSLSDSGKLLKLNNGSANDLQVPLNGAVAFPIGTQILIMQYGAGQVTVTSFWRSDIELIRRQDKTCSTICHGILDKDRNR